MSYLSMKNLLEAGVHFGHQTRRWNPKMKPYIFGARNGIYIIDLQKTVQLFKTAYEFVADTVAAGHSVLFVGTKKQATQTIQDEANRSGMFYVNSRWLGGTLTNFVTIKKSIDRLKHLEKIQEDGTMELYHKKEILLFEREMQKLKRNLSGIKEMDRLPGALFVIDPRKEHIATAEARRLGIPVVSVVDSNCDPDDVDYIIPGNDDAIRAIKLMTSKIADACLAGRARWEEASNLKNKGSDDESSESDLETELIEKLEVTKQITDSILKIKNPADTVLIEAQNTEIKNPADTVLIEAQNTEIKNPADTVLIEVQNTKNTTE